MTTKATLWVALDVPRLADAERLMERLAPHRAFKVGLELYHRVGPETVRRWVRSGFDIFLDLKLHDIPRTVAGAVSNLSDLGVSLLTLHIVGGSEMLKAADQARGATDLIGVTVLTSLDDGDLIRLGYREDAPRLVDRFVELARAIPLAGVVASSGEVAAVAAHWPLSRRVVPGIRLLGDEAGDQKRTGDPVAAVRLGATDLVLGRTVTRAPDPARALADITRRIVEMEDEDDNGKGIH